MPDLGSIHLPDWVVLVLQIVLIVIVALIALRLARTFVHGVFQTLIDREATEGRARDLSRGEIQRRMSTLDSLGAGVIQFLIVVIAGLMILGRLGIDIGPAIAGLGIVGIAIGFGAQSLVRDYFNGVLILIENQYDKGDVVRIAGVEGTVEDLTLRRTTLRDFSGNVHTVPNSAVTVASNLTRGYAVISEEIQVPSAELVEPATDVINGVGRALADDPRWAELVLEPPHVERIDALGASGITLRVSGRVLAGNRWSFAGELRRGLLEAFRKQSLPLVPSAPPATPAASPGASTPAGAPAAESLPSAAAVLGGTEPPPGA
jgi:small conductance mechanosensitive channel